MWDAFFLNGAAGYVRILAPVAGAAVAFAMNDPTLVHIVMTASLAAVLPRGARLSVLVASVLSAVTVVARHDAVFGDFWSFATAVGAGATGFVGRLSMLSLLTSGARVARAGSMHEFFDSIRRSTVIQLTLIMFVKMFVESPEDAVAFEQLATTTLKEWLSFFASVL